MSDRPEPPDGDSAFSQRVYRYLENRHSEQELAELNQDLRIDSRKRDLFVSLCITRQSLVQWQRGRAQYRREMQFDRAIEWEPSSDRDLDEAMILPALDLSSAAELAGDQPERFEPTPHVPPQRPHPLDVWKRPASIAAGILFAILASMIVWIELPHRSAPVAVISLRSSVEPPPSLVQPTTVPTPREFAQTVAPKPLATIGICLDSRWDGQGELARDSELPVGMHSLDRGVAQLTLSGGASVVLQAPCKFEVQSEKRIHLIDGQLSANCPHGCAGLSVLTPDMDAVDLGTEFGVSVRPQHQTHLEVFKGQVQAAPTGALAVSTDSIVGADHAVVVKAGSGSVVNDVATPLAFVRYQELADRAAAGGNAGFNRWRAFSQTLRQDPDLVAYYTFEKDQNQPTKLVNQSLRTLSQHDGVLGVPGVDGSIPGWTSGRWSQKGALLFGEQTNNVVRIPNGSELTPLPPFTYMMWVKRWDVRRPTHILSAAAGSVRCLDLTLIGEDGEKTPFREINSVYFDMGPSKSAQQSRRQGVYKVLGTDFAWSLIALTMSPDNTAQVYVDGARVGEFPVIIPQLNRTGELWLGQPDLDAKDLGKSLVYHGWIDEFAIFHRCLSDAEIWRMYDAGKPS